MGNKSSREMSMPEKLFWLSALLALLFGLYSESAAEMASENYRIPGSVHSAGGNPTGSANYQINGTVGQPSPLMNPLEPPLSDTYDLYPGFWHGIAALEITCPGDFDGADLSEYLFDSGGFLPMCLPPISARRIALS